MERQPSVISLMSSASTLDNERRTHRAKTRSKRAGSRRRLARESSSTSLTSTSLTSTSTSRASLSPTGQIIDLHRRVQSLSPVPRLSEEMLPLQNDNKKLRRRRRRSSHDLSSKDKKEKKKKKESSRRRSSFSSSRRVEEDAIEKSRRRRRGINKSHSHQHLLASKSSSRKDKQDGTGTSLRRRKSLPESLDKPTRRRKSSVKSPRREVEAGHQPISPELNRRIMQQLSIGDEALPKPSSMDDNDTNNNDHVDCVMRHVLYNRPQLQRSVSNCATTDERMTESTLKLHKKIKQNDVNSTWSHVSISKTASETTTTTEVPSPVSRRSQDEQAQNDQLVVEATIEETFEELKGCPTSKFYADMTSEISSTYSMQEALLEQKKEEKELLQKEIDALCASNRCKEERVQSLHTEVCKLSQRLSQLEG